jgi:hypothetical protein
VESVIAVTLLAGVAGCGGDSSDAPIDELTRYLPAGDAGYVAYADVAAVREELGLPADADALDYGILLDRQTDPAAPEARLLDTARLALPSLGFSINPLEPDPVTEAFDGGAIAAAATGATKEALMAIRTSQPFDELADALADEGYERDGDVLSAPGAPIGEVVDAGDGIFVLGEHDASAADAVADPPGGPEAALALVEPADEPVLQAVGGLPADDDCVTGYGGWHEASAETGDFRIAVDGPADAGRVDLQGLAELTDTELGEPSADGDVAEVPFTGGGEGGASPLRDLQASLGLDLYDCD